MKKEIQAAELKRYNANSRGTRTGDCVNRALSLALDMSYQDMRKILNAAANKSGYGRWNIQSVYYPIMKKYGCSEWQTKGLDFVDKGDAVHYLTTLDEFVDNIADPSKTYLVITGKSETTSDHIVCVRDGKVWDSWDSRDQHVFKYSVAPANSKQLSEGLELGPLAYDYAEPAITEQIDKYVKRRKWDCSYWSVKTFKATNFQIRVSCEIVLEPTDWIDKKRKYEFQILYAIEPTMTEDEAIKFIEETSKVRVYDRMYAINDQEKKLKEAEEVKRSATSEEDLGRDRLYLDGREKRFYNSLPGWVKPLIMYISVQNPGQYSDSYVVEIKPLPTDPNKALHPRITFEWYESSAVKDMLQRYKQHNEIPHEDYSPYEEY